MDRIAILELVRELILMSFKGIFPFRNAAGKRAQLGALEGIGEIFIQIALVLVMTDKINPGTVGSREPPVP